MIRQWITNLQISPSQWMIIGFGGIIIVGTFLLVLPVSSTNGQSVDLLDAFFTASSAVCVTGLSVVDIHSTFTIFGQLVIMMLIQIGGIGFMTFGVVFAILLGKRLGLNQRVLIQQSTNSVSAQGIVRLSLNIFLISFFIEFAASSLLTVHWYHELGLKSAVYYAVFHAISAFNNAGFALWPDNLSRFVGDPVVNIVIIFLIVAGGIGFAVIMDILHKRKWSLLMVQSKIVLLTSMYLILFGFVIIFILELLNVHTLQSFTWGDRFWAALFQSVTARTAGFNTINIGNMMTASQFLIIFLMFIGASSGSTGGGIKTNTFMVIVLAVISSIKGHSEVQIFKRKIASEYVLKALAVIILSLGVILAVSFLLTITEFKRNDNFLAILFEVTSAFSTSGLSMGLTQDLSSLGKIIISLTMFVGRLGPLTLVFAMSQKKKALNIGYAEEKVSIG